MLPLFPLDLGRVLLGPAPTLQHQQSLGNAKPRIGVRARASVRVNVSERVCACLRVRRSVSVRACACVDAHAHVCVPARAFVCVLVLLGLVDKKENDGRGENKNV